jgi:hypothetical protein
VEVHEVQYKSRTKQLKPSFKQISS